uniref:acyl-CoA thioesterase n=1 Tax=Natronococcus wangiae TaxID=3068275 RepID=UPI00387ECCD8
MIYVEEARVRYFRDVLDEEFTELNGAIVHQDIEYSSSITLEDRVTVPYRVARLGETSLTMEFEVRTTGDDGDSLAAEGSVTQVILNDDDEPRPIPDAWREAVRGFEDAPIDGVV